MTVTLPEVVSDLTGLTGLRILRAIGRGERDATALAALHDHRCQESAATIARAYVQSQEGFRMPAQCERATRFSGQRRKTYEERARGKALGCRLTARWCGS